MSAVANTEHNEGYDAELDHQFDENAWAKRENSLKLFLTNTVKYSVEFRKRLGDTVQTLKYGNGPKQIMEIVKPVNAKEDTPIMLFIHGGYWIITSRDMYSFTVEKALDNGWIGVSVGYDQAPQVSLTTITNEIRDAFVYLSNLFPRSIGLTVVGHSAGGHLVSMLLATDWESYSSEHKNLIPIRKCVPVSGVLDIRPTTKIRHNDHLKLTKTETAELNPLLQTEKAIPTIKKFGTRVTAVVGQYDPPLIIQQSKDYVEALQRQSVDAEFIEIAGLDHFNLIEKLVEPEYKLNKIIFEGY